MNYFRCGGGRSTHTATKIDVAKTPLASFESNVSGLYLPEILAYIQATQEGTGDPSPSNPRAINGWSETNVTVEKNNILKYANTSQSGTISGVDYSFSNGRIVLNGTTTGLFTLSLDLAQSANLNPTANKIMFRNNQANMNVIVYFRRSNTNIHYWTMDTINRVAETWTDTGNENVDSVTITVVANTTLSNFVLFPLLCEKTYNPTTITTNLGGTYYGGYLNVTTGLLTVTRWFKQNTWGDGINATDMGNNTRKLFKFDTQGYNVYPPHVVNFPQLCNVAPYLAKFATDSVHFYCNTNECILFLPDNTPDDTIVQFSGELATPQTVQLTPSQIEQLLGENNVFCSSGDVAVKFWKID